jgi:hypothetical protein
MYGARIAGVAVVAVTIIALASLAGRVTEGHAASQQTAVAPVLTGFATGMLDAVVGGIRDEAIAAGFESMLSFIGLDSEPTATAAQVDAIDARVQRVEAALAQATATVNETKRNVDAARVDLDSIKDTGLKTAYSQAAQAAFDVVHPIDTALRKIEAANAAPMGSSGARTRNDAENYISEHIDGAAERLQVVVFGDPRGNVGGTPLMETAFSVATGNHFLNHTESVHLRYLTVFYTEYEALAAAITAEYRRSRPGYRESDVKTYLNNWIATIKAQENGRRDAVPAGSVVDARTLKMWSTAPGRTRSPLSKATGPGSYSDWGVPSTGTYQSLVSGYTTTPKDFLHNHGFDVTQGHVVISNEKRGYTVCQPGFATLDLGVNPPVVGTSYGADPGGCKPGTHNGATTYQRCVKKARGGKGGVTTVCTTQTDQQQVTYNARKFNTGTDLFFAVRGVAVGSFLPPNYKGTP